MCPRNSHVVASSANNQASKLSNLMGLGLVPVLLNHPHYPPGGTDGSGYKAWEEKAAREWWSRCMYMTVNPWCIPHLAINRYTVQHLYISNVHCFLYIFELEHKLASNITESESGAYNALFLCVVYLANCIIIINIQHYSQAYKL